MIHNLRKTLPNTESQHEKEIDAITRPSTRAQQRKQFLDTAFTKMIKGDSFGFEAKDEVPERDRAGSAD